LRTKDLDGCCGGIIALVGEACASDLPLEILPAVATCGASTGVDVGTVDVGDDCCGGSCIGRGGCADGAEVVEPRAGDDFLGVLARVG
jgi:hypothetical protein